MSPDDQSAKAVAPESHLDRLGWLASLGGALMATSVLWPIASLFTTLPEPPGHPYVYAAPFAIGGLLWWLSLHLSTRAIRRRFGDHVCGLTQVDPDQDVYIAICDCGWRSEPSSPADALRQGHDHSLSMETPQAG